MGPGRDKAFAVIATEGDRTCNTIPSTCAEEGQFLIELSVWLARQLGMGDEITQLESVVFAVQELTPGSLLAIAILHINLVDRCFYSCRVQRNGRPIYEPTLLDLGVGHQRLHHRQIVATEARAGREICRAMNALLYGEDNVVGVEPVDL